MPLSYLIVTFVKRWRRTVTCFEWLRGKNPCGAGTSTYLPGFRRTPKRPVLADEVA
jgi:hypothetical protein